MRSDRAFPTQGGSGTQAGQVGQVTLWSRSGHHHLLWLRWPTIFAHRLNLLVLPINFCDNMWCDLSWLSAPVTCCSNMLPQLFPTINHNLKIFLWLWMHGPSVIRVKDKDRVVVIASKMGYRSFQWKAWPGHLSLEYPWRTGDQNWAGGLLIWVVTMSDYLTCWSLSMCNCWYQVYCIAITTFSREECPGQISLDHPWWWGGKFSFKVKLFVKVRLKTLSWTK